MQPPPDPILPLLQGEGTHVFAVIDGARVDRLQHLLHRLQLDPKPLYLDHKGGTPHAAGPHLVPCRSDIAILDLRISVAADAMVWWLWPGSDATDALARIYRHLRGLGAVEIPAGYPEHRAGAAQLERVLFRHADPHVMAQVLPVLNPAQRARVYGKAQAIVIDDTLGAGLRIARVPADLPVPPTGFLRLTAAQMDAITDRRGQERTATLMSYMRRNAKAETSMLTDRELEDLALRVDRRAAQLGLSESGSTLLLAFLAAVTGGAALTAPQVERAILESDLPPDEAVTALFDAMANSSDLQGGQ
ncbi:MAG: DUF4123 domain-containing protein [Pseudorhodobacter sp.]